MCFYLFYILKSVMFLMKMNQPRETLRISCDYVMLTFLSLSRNVATIRDVFDTQRGLHFYFVPFLFK